MVRWHGRAPLLMAAVTAGVATATPLAAQITEVARSPIASVAQLTFGNLCEDRFILRNDGADPVNVEFGVPKGTEHTRATINGHEQIELRSPSRDDLELWMDGKLIAKAEKENRSCRDVQGNASVVVAPLQVATTENSNRNRNRMGAYPFYDPWYYGYGGMYAGFGYYRPFYSGFYGVPIIIGGRSGGGRRR